MVYFISGFADPDLVVLEVESGVDITRDATVVFRSYYLLDVHVQQVVEGVDVLFHQRF